MKFHRRHHRRLRRTLAVAFGVVALSASPALAATAEQFLGPQASADPQSTPIGGSSAGNGVDYGPSAPIEHRAPVTTAIDDGFAWGDAGIGAAVAAGLILLSLTMFGGVGRSAYVRKSHITQTAVLALAIGALAAPLASAKTDFRSPDARDAAAASESRSSQDLRSPDARDSSSPVTSSPVVQDYRSADTRDFASGRTIPDVTVVRVAEPASASSGLDWGDAGIGAGALLALILLGTGGTMVVMHRRRSQPAV